MTDKDVERNVRSTTVEGIRTPTERHVHGIGEKHAISFGERSEAKKTREVLLDKFRLREGRRKKSPARGTGGGESAEPERTSGGVDTAGEDNDRS